MSTPCDALPANVGEVIGAAKRPSNPLPVLELHRGQRLHLVLGSPPKEALGAFREGDVDRALWEAAAYRKDDLLLTVLDCRPRLLLCLERAAAANSRPSSSRIEVAATWSPPRLLSVPCVQARLGQRLPSAPGPVPDHLAGPLLDAVAKESLNPTPLRVKEGWRCDSTARARSSGLQVAVLGDSRGFCSGCERDFGSLFGGQGYAALEVHHLDALSTSADQPVTTATGRLVAVCGACHNLLHARRTRNLQEIRYEWRPLCPECHARLAQHLVFGLPGEPPPFDDVVFGGCIVPGRSMEWQCGNGACRYQWSSLDEPTEGDLGYGFA